MLKRRRIRNNMLTDDGSLFETERSVYKNYLKQSLPILGERLVRFFGNDLLIHDSRITEVEEIHDSLILRVTCYNIEDLSDPSRGFIQTDFEVRFSCVQAAEVSCEAGRKRLDVSTVAGSTGLYWEVHIESYHSNSGVPDLSVFISLDGLKPCEQGELLVVCGCVEITPLDLTLYTAIEENRDRFRAP